MSDCQGDCSISQLAFVQRVILTGAGAANATLSSPKRLTRRVFVIIWRIRQHESVPSTLFNAPFC